MIRLYAEQLSEQLQETLFPCYMLFGNEPLLLQESQDCIRKRACVQRFEEHFNITLDITTDWDAIFNICQMRNLFASRQTLLLLLPDSGINAAMSEKMLQLTALLHNDIILILLGSKLSSSMKNDAWFKALHQNAVLVSCFTPGKAQLPHWVAKRAAKIKLALDNDVCQLLCYCYEGNLLALSQALERLSLLYPDGNLTLPRVEAAINNATHFTPFHWIDAALERKSKRAIRILRQLQLEGIEPIILLRNVQSEVLLLLTLKRKIVTIPLRILFNHYKIWQNRRLLLMQAVERLTLVQLYSMVTVMTKIELALKQNYNYSAWFDLNTLTLLLCGNPLPVKTFNI